MTRARTDLDETEADLDAALQRVRAALDPVDGSADDTALNEIETFCAVAIRVMRKSNPSKVRDAARIVEIKARLDGVPVVRGAA